MTWFRRPVPPSPVECFALSHPAVGRAHAGLRILHLSDLHVRRLALASARTTDLLNAVASVEVDLIAITGDIMDEPGNEDAAAAMLREIMSRARARLGVCSVLGNHDRPTLRRRLESLEGLTCLSGVGGVGSAKYVVGSSGGNVGRLRVIGLDWPEDVLSLAGESFGDDPEVLTIALVHHPAALIGLAEVRMGGSSPGRVGGVPIVLAGHTHAGQVRLGARYAPHTSSDLPPHQATGMLRLKDTLCCVSRGVGDGVVDGLRLNCPRQIPLYTLVSGPMPTAGWAASTDVVNQVVAW